MTATLVPPTTATAPAPPRPDLLEPAALAVVERLHRTFEDRRRAVLAETDRRRAAGPPQPELDPSPVALDPDWQVAPPPAALRRRHVELTSPLTRRYATSAMRSGADVWLADLEDSFSPTWDNVREAHEVLADVVDGRIAPDEGTPAPTLMVRPRALHLHERHLQVDGEPVAASFADVGLLVHHHGRTLAARGLGPFLYLPKISSVAEAELWRDVLEHLEREVRLPTATIRTTVLIETLPAALRMEEILHVLRDRATGLNAGRWDYLFSVLKEVPDAPLPDRHEVTMTSSFMRAFTERLVATCHRRGTHAIAGPASVLPRGAGWRAAGLALARVRADADTFAQDGFDGSWVAHPDLVSTVRGVYRAVACGRDHQIGRTRPDRIDDVELLDFASAGGARTIEGLRANVRACLRYLASWLTGTGAIAVDGEMEDAATAEIARMQVRQWLRQRTVLDEGIQVTPALVHRVLADERQRAESGGDVPLARLGDAVALVLELVEGADVEFLTEVAYPRLG